MRVSRVRVPAVRASSVVDLAEGDPARAAVRGVVGRSDDATHGGPVRQVRGVRDPEVALPVRGGRHRVRASRGAAGARQTEDGLAEAQQRARAERDRAVADGHAVERRPVRRAAVGDRDAAVLADGHGAVGAGDVRVVERHVGVDGTADSDRSAVQQVHTAGVGARHHVQPGGGRLVGPVVRTRDLEERTAPSTSGVRRGRSAARRAAPRPRRARWCPRRRCRVP